MLGLSETRDIQDTVPSDVRHKLFRQHQPEDVLPNEEQEGREDEEDSEDSESDTEATETGNKFNALASFGDDE